MSSKKIQIEDAQDSMRLDQAVADILDVSRSQVQKLLSSDRVFINGELPKKGGMKVTVGMTIEITDDSTSREKVVLPDVSIISETDDYLVIDKPAGLLVHPTEANEQVTLAAWITKQYPEIVGVGESDVRPGIVHRLDKDVSGLMVLAKTQESFDHLKQQFKERTVEKEYLALVHGVIDADSDTIDFVIDRGKDGRMVARPKTDLLKLKNATRTITGKKALTTFLVKKRFSRYTFLQVCIHTGRMHQIRVHLFAYGHPVVGDTLYQNKKMLKKSEAPIDRLFLQAYRLSFTDLHGEKKEFQIGLDDGLANYMDVIQ